MWTHGQAQNSLSKVNEWENRKAVVASAILVCFCPPSPARCLSRIFTPSVSLSLSLEPNFRLGILEKGRSIMASTSGLLPGNASESYLRRQSRRTLVCTGVTLSHDVITWLSYHTWHLLWLFMQSVAHSNARHYRLHSLCLLLTLAVVVLAYICSTWKF